MIKRTIYLYLFFILLSKFAISFIAATYVIFLMSHGLDIFQVGVVNAVFYVTLLICEIPTGVFADIFGRKISYAFSYFLFSASMFVYSASNSLPGFMTAEAIGAIGFTFGNGSFDAWLKDKLDFHGYEKSKLRAVFSQKSQIGQIASGVGALIGAFLGGFNLAFPWIASGIMFFAGGILVVLLLKEEYFDKKKVSFSESISFTKNAIKQGFKNKVICFVVMMTLIQVFILQAPNMQWQPFFSKFVAEKSSLGYIFFGLSLAIAAGSFLSLWLLKKMKNSEKGFLVASQVLMGAGMILAGALRIFFLCLPAFLLHEFARGLFAPIKDNYINQSIPEKTKERSTLLSIESMSHHIGGAFGLLASGFIAKQLSIPATWIIFGGFLIIITLLISRNGKR